MKVPTAVCEVTRLVGKLPHPERALHQRHVCDRVPATEMEKIQSIKERFVIASTYIVKLLRVRRGDYESMSVQYTLDKLTAYLPRISAHPPMMTENSKMK
jgi:hypothetical protein